MPSRRTTSIISAVSVLLLIVSEQSSVAEVPAPPDSLQTIVVSETPSPIAEPVLPDPIRENLMGVSYYEFSGALGPPGLFNVGARMWFGVLGVGIRAGGLYEGMIWDMLVEDDDYDYDSDIPDWCFGGAWLEANCRLYDTRQARIFAGAILGFTGYSGQEGGWAAPYTGVRLNYTGGGAFSFGIMMLKSLRTGNTIPMIELVWLERLIPKRER